MQWDLWEPPSSAKFLDKLICFLMLKKKNKLSALLSGNPTCIVCAHHKIYVIDMLMATALICFLLVTILIVIFSQ